MLIPLEDENGKVRLIDDEIEYAIVFTNAGFISNSLIHYAYRRRQNLQRLNSLQTRVVVCKNDVTQDNILSIKSEAERLNSKYIGINK